MTAQLMAAARGTAAPSLRHVALLRAPMAYGSMSVRSRCRRARAVRKCMSSRIFTGAGEFRARACRRKAWILAFAPGPDRWRLTIGGAIDLIRRSEYMPDVCCCRREWRHLTYPAARHGYRRAFVSILLAARDRLVRRGGAGAQRGLNSQWATVSLGKYLAGRSRTRST